MNPIEEFFHIINDFKEISTSADEDLLQRPVWFYALNGINVSDFNYRLNKLVSKIQYSTNEFPSPLIAMIEKDVNQAKKEFSNIEIEGKNYLFQDGVRYLNHNKGFTKDMDELIQRITIGEEINLNNVKYDGIVKDYNLFSELKYNALLKLEDIAHSLKSTPTIIPKLKTKFTVAELSLLFRLLQEEGIIDKENNEELYRFISSNFSSKLSSEISNNTTKNKFLSPDNTAIKNLDILLVNLRQQLKKIQ